MQPTNQNQILFNDFKDGWCPSDDATNGRKNCLLKMSGVTLDENGSLALAQGMAQVEGPYPANAHSLFVKLMCGDRNVYVGLKDGSVWRNALNLIKAGEGSVKRTAFGVYGDFVLIFSGAARVKDYCGATEPSRLGLAKPGCDLIINPLTFAAISGTDFTGDLTHYIATLGSVAVVDSKLEITVSNDVIVHKTAYIQNLNVVDFPKDFSGSDNDTFQFQLSILNPNRLVDVTIRFLLKSDASEYYEYNWVKGQNLDLAGPAGPFTFSVRKGDFARGGSDSSLDWSQVIGIGIGIGAAELVAGSYYFPDAIVDLWDFKFLKATDGSLNGTYQWVQVNVLNTGNYLALSGPGPISEEVQVINGIAEVIPCDPTIDEPQANEVWIYRRGGTLPVFYRVGVIKYDELGPLYDNLSDADALALGITLNTNITPITSVLPPEDIIEIVGPVFGRMIYFSATSIYFSETNNPESFDPGNTIKLVNDDVERFQWARKVSENTIIIGTLKDVYILTGTYVKFPDGALDVYLRSLGTNKPPMSRFAAVYNGNVIYFASQEWVMLDPSGRYINLISPNTDVLYTGRTINGEAGVPTIIDNIDVSYPCVVAKNKIWLTVPQIVDYTDPANEDLFTYRMEVFDLTRKYWRPVPYGARLLAISDDEALYGFFFETKTVNYMDSPFSKLLNYT